MKQRSLIVRTKNGVLQTPFFMPDATRAVVRGLSSEDIRAAGIEAVVVNTYHLFLRPGVKMVADMGGVHSLMRWTGPVLSDSGGYQVYSLIHKKPGRGRVTEEGVEFFSPLDGSRHLLTPERSVEIQFDLGVDMMVCLDDPRPNTASRHDIAEAVDRSIRWGERCKKAYILQLERRGISEEERPLLFGVIQGGPHRDLRSCSAEGVVGIGFDGYGFGARHVDEQGVFMEDIVGYTASLLPEDKPRFALGVGNPSDVVKSYALGWDMFDCVVPTREGRHGRAFCFASEYRECTRALDDKESWYETVEISRSQYTRDTSVIEEGCDCYACSHGYSRAYMRHLLMIKDSLGARLLSQHNLRFYQKMMERLPVSS